MPFQSPNHQCQGTEGKTGSEPGLQNLAPAIAKGYSLKNLCGSQPYLENWSTWLNKNRVHTRTFFTRHFFVFCWSPYILLRCRTVKFNIVIIHLECYSLWPVKSGCWFVGGDDLTGVFAHLIASVVTSTSIILSSDNVQNGYFRYWLTQVHLENGR